MPSDNTRDLVPELLREIREEMRGMRDELRGLRVEHGGHLERLQAELSAHRAETRRELMKLNARQPEPDAMAERVAALEARVERLEEQPPKRPS
ncbi:MAG: hypothetical protein HY904_20515 [Deltaproteobacteria bacterium]|nr:hypothetical protein [Deltaproteobacteria bacterium]